MSSVCTRAMWVSLLASFFVFVVVTGQTVYGIAQDPVKDTRDVGGLKPRLEHAGSLLGLQVYRASQMADTTVDGSESADSEPGETSSGTTATTAASTTATTDDEPTTKSKTRSNSTPNSSRPKSGSSESERSSSETRRTSTSSKENKDKKDSEKKSGLSPGIIVAIALGAVVATALPLVLCFYCGCVTCMNEKLRNRNDEDEAPQQSRMVRSSSRKSALDCRNSECGSFHVSNDDSESV